MSVNKKVVSRNGKKVRQKPFGNRGKSSQSDVASFRKIQDSIKKEIVHIKDLIPDKSNVRRHAPRGIGMIVSALNEVGAARSGVIDENGRVLAGNATLEALGQAGITNVKVVDAKGDEWVVVRRKGLTEKQKIKLAIYDNRTNELSDWDVPALENLDLDLSPWFTEQELIKIGVEDNGDLADVEPQFDKAEALRKHYGVELGQIWELGDHRLMCGDSTKAKDVGKLAEGNLVSLVVTDPPYGVSYADKNKFLNAMGRGNHIETEIENDHGTKEETQAMWKAAFREMSTIMERGAVVYCFMPQGGDQMMMMMMMMMMGAGIEPRHEIIWLKNNHVLGRVDYAYKHEPILYAWKGAGHKFYGGFQTSILEFPKPQVNDSHPTMKPIELVAKLIGNSSLEKDSVYDGFLGSGTTLIACEQLKRRCFAMEISPAYVAVAIQRWVDLTGKKPKCR